MTQLRKGLTSAEVAQRIQRGQINRAATAHLREYLQIVARNLFTWFNAMVTPAAIALFGFGEVQGGIAVSGFAIVNTAIGLFQEIRAKRHLDKLSILVEAKARVLRDGAPVEIPAGDVVLGEHILLQAGETVVADGPVLVSEFLEVDEALLTGESDPVRRHDGENVLSGSFCVAGQGAYRADKVGADAFANRTSQQARRYHFTNSPLTRVINRLVTILSYTALALCVLYTIAYLLRAGPPETHDRETRQYVAMIAATITSMVPQGMVLTATIAFSMGAIVMSRRGAIVQRLNAVETMAAVDVVCTDKTGTLTTNRLKLDQILALNAPGSAGASPSQATELLRAFASASVDRQNKNLQALTAALGGASVELLDQIPFKSQNRYSAVRVRLDGKERLLVLGAPETLQRWLAETDAESFDERLHPLRQRGLRILLLGEMAPVPLADKTTLPDAPLRPIALACLADELRPEAGDVLKALYAQGIEFKVISGDNPETVQGTVSHLDLPLARDPVVSGDELKASAEAARLIEERSVFGRVAPEQKVQIVETLQRAGRHVAMIGDGVNDVLPIKRADLGIAMGEGSQASKTVSGLVLESNNFALLPETLEEGRTIVRNLRRSSKLFLVKNVYSLILILVYYCGWLGFHFPYVPQQVTLLNWTVIGIPALAIAVSRQRSRAATKPRFLREVGSFALRTGVLFGLGGVAIQLIAHQLAEGTGPAHRSYERTMLLSTLVLLGVTALWRALVDGEPAGTRPDRYWLLGLAAIPLYLPAMYLPPAAGFFQLTPLGWSDWGLVLVVVGLTYAATLLSDRWLG
ncbi:MAG: cation-translocating P-type ATPase [Gemmataceae bacterium]